MTAFDSLDWDTPDPRDAGYWVAIRDALTSRRIKPSATIIAAPLAPMSAVSIRNIIKLAIDAIKANIGNWAPSQTGKAYSWASFNRDYTSANGVLGQVPIEGMPLDSPFLSDQLKLIHEAILKLRYRIVPVYADRLQVGFSYWPASIDDETPNEFIQRMSADDAWGIYTLGVSTTAVTLGFGVQSYDSGSFVETFTWLRTSWVINPLSVIGSLCINAEAYDYNETGYIDSFDAVGTGLSEGLNVFTCGVGKTTVVPVLEVSAGIIPRLLDNDAIPASGEDENRGMVLTGIIDYGYAFLL